MDKTQDTSGFPTQEAASEYAGRDSYFFAGPELNRRLDLLRHLTVNSERIPLVVGQAGVGKSTILKQLLSQAPDDWVLCRIDANLMLQPEQLFSILVREFGVEVNDERVIERLISRFEDLQQEGRLPVILVDDAHLLPVATIISLLRVHERRPASHALIRILLFATPQIDELLKTPQIQAMNLLSLQRLELPPLNQEQTEQMIHQLFLRRGLTDQLELTPGQLEKIYRDTAGLPGEIINRLEQMLDTTPSSQPPSIMSEWRSLFAGRSVLALVGAAAVVIALLSVLVYQDEINALFYGEGPADTMVSLPPVAQETLIPLQLPESKSVPQASKPQLPDGEVFLPKAGSEKLASSGQEARLALPEISTEGNDGPAAEPFGVPATEIPPDPQAGPGGALPIKQDHLLSQVSETATTPEGAAASADPDRWSLAVQLDAKYADTLTVGETTIESPAADSDGGGGRVAPPEATKEPPAPDESREQNMTASAPAPVVQIEQPIQLPETPVVEKTVKPPLDQARSAAGSDPAIRSEDWLLQQNSSAYTLQLIGLQEQEAVERFVRTHGLQGSCAYFRSLRNGRPWFSVVYGIYPDREGAVAGRSKLPAALRGTGVWPRSLASVQQAIQENRKPNP